MCNRYIHDWETTKTASRLQAIPVGVFSSDTNFYPRSIAPALRMTGDKERELLPMQFSFCPPKCPTKTHPKHPYTNARIESVERWPWKWAIRETRCVVPITSFEEPAYWGDETAGTMIEFARADGDLLLSAGIYRWWWSPDGSEELATMALLLRPASEYVDAHGHHRQPLFIEESRLDDWLTPEELTTEDAVALLREIRAEPELTHTHVRDMAVGWKSRVKTHVANRDKQAAEVAERGRVF